VSRPRGKPYHNLARRRFGFLKVIAFAGYNKWSQSRWLCVCKCGDEHTTTGDLLVSGRQKSCGCNRYPRGKKNPRYTTGAGSIHLNEFRTYCAMRQRCGNPKNNRYEDYGGRGISICKRWSGPNGFVHFMQDMGRRPPGKSIDRIEVNGNYTAKNCRWATKLQQANNKRNSKPPDGYVDPALREETF